MPPFPQNGHFGLLIEMANSRLKKHFSSIETYLEPKYTIFDQQIVCIEIILHTLKWPFQNTKMAILRK